MPKFNIDEQTQLSEPIELVLEGKTYVIRTVTTDLMKEVMALADGNKDPGAPVDVDAPIKQLAVLLGIDPKELSGIDIRKIGKALEFVTGTVTDALKKPKN